jgi:hypothetical protein
MRMKEEGRKNTKLKKVEEDLICLLIGWSSMGRMGWLK